VTHVSAPLQNAPSSQADVSPNSGPVNNRLGPFVSVPLSGGAMESSAVVPLVSLNPQRATRPVPDVSSLKRLAWICACVRTTFQMRTSSTSPSKKPAGVLAGLLGALPTAEVIPVPIAAGAMLSDLGVRAAAVMAVGDASSAPFR